MLKACAAAVSAVVMVGALFGAAGMSSAEEKAAAPAAGGGTTPLDRIKATPKGELKNPYTDDNAEIVAAGQKLYMRAGCNGCHGGGGGGGMCPPLSNDTWVYGGDDDTLFRLVSEGSDALQKDGYHRIGKENVVGPMMPFGTIVKTDDDLWKIITFIRSNYRGGPSRKFGDPSKNPTAAPADVGKH